MASTFFTLRKVMKLRGVWHAKLSIKFDIKSKTRMMDKSQFVRK
jgi:hypothetical protein